MNLLSDGIPCLGVRSMVSESSVRAREESIEMSVADGILKEESFSVVIVANYLEAFSRLLSRLSDKVKLEANND
jgi:hypothetical protein